MTFTVLLPWGCRSDKSLLDPVLSQLRKRTDIEYYPYEIPAGKFKESFEVIDELLKKDPWDLVICNADRIEMCGAAAAAFFNHVPIAQMYAGIKNNVGTMDDINRHVITLWSDLQFCESACAAERVFEMKSAVGLPPNAHNVGITHFDDVELKPCKTPEIPFTLVLYNAPATHLDKRHQQDQILEDIKTIRQYTTSPIDGHGYNVMAIMPAPDPSHELIRGWLEAMRVDHGWYVVESLPKENFLYVLSRCTKYVSNSSTVVYEAPEYLPDSLIVHIGTRNSGRDRGPFEKGASDKIVTIIEEFLCNRTNGKETGNIR